MEYKIGQTIGPYTLLEECGAGAYGTVYLAQSTMSHHRIALKILSLSEKIISRELQGLINYRDCRHSNLLQIHHIDKIDGHLYYTMDAADNIGDQSHYVPDTLAHRLEKRKTLPSSEIIKMADELLDGLAYLHKHGLVHRDIKPDNILWVDGRATLGDIGLTSSIENSSLVGTPGFMSKELLSGKRCATPEDDLYALGKVIYCALTGCSPKDYPHYPPNATITDAAPIIKAYTMVCQSPSPIKTSEAMKKLITEQEKFPKRAIMPVHIRKYLTLSAVIVCLFILFYFLNEKYHIKHEALPHPTAELNVPLQEYDAHALQIPSNANIVSDLQLLYSSRNSDILLKNLASAHKSIIQLDAEVKRKLDELNSHRMDKKNYLLAQNLIYQAQKEHLSKDPLCRLAVKEEAVQKFMTLHSSNFTDHDLEQFKKILDDRDCVLQELNNPHAPPQKNKEK